MSDLFKSEKPLKIVKLVAENVKKLTAISITPQGNVVQITGRNGSGKTSTLNSIWWALAGATNVQSAPIRKGQEKATIKLDLGEVIVTRTFAKNDDGTARTSITVENAEGARFPSPQRMLDSLLGSLTFDPLHFARMKPKDQFDALAAFVPSIDFGRIEGLNRTDFEKRTAVKRRARDLAGQVTAIEIPETIPERVDESALVDELAAVGKHNGDIEARQARREAASRDVERLREESAAETQRADDLRRQAAEADTKAAGLLARADELAEKLATAPALDEPKDQAEIRRRLDDAKRTNALLDRAARRDQLKEEQRTAEAEAQALTDRIQGRDREKQEAIAAAKLPVDGLGFGPDCITLNGLPFDQASDAEQLRTSIAVAMASNPKLRVILVRDGSLLDDNGWKLLAEMADAADCQVWIESVNSSGKVGIVLEDGHVVSTPESRNLSMETVSA
jgi:energy-coupling factor transporter ATP-binding protein EcfA2